jgi:hypothetical protein
MERIEHELKAITKRIPSPGQVECILHTACALFDMQQRSLERQVHVVVRGCTRGVEGSCSSLICTLRYDGERIDVVRQ